MQDSTTDHTFGTSLVYSEDDIGQLIIEDAVKRLKANAPEGETIHVRWDGVMVKNINGIRQPIEFRVDVSNWKPVG